MMMWACRSATPEADAAGGRPDAIRVLLADDHDILREGLASLLDDVEGIRVVGEAADGITAVEMATRLRPDVVLMDITMPRLSGIDATRRIKALLPGMRVIVLSMHTVEDMADALRDAGADDYLSKGSPAEELIGAIRGR